MTQKKINNQICYHGNQSQKSQDKKQNKKQIKSKVQEFGFGKLKVEKNKSNKILERVTSNSKSKSAQKQLKLSNEHSGPKRYHIRNSQNQPNSVLLIPSSEHHQPHSASSQMLKIPKHSKITNFQNSNTMHNKTLLRLTNEPIDNSMLHIKFGRIQQTISYKSFIKSQPKRSQKILKYLQKWLQKYKIKTAIIHIQPLLSLFKKKHISNHQILSTFNNYQQLKKQFINIIPGLQFYQRNINHGQHLAATKIQSFFKMITCQKQTTKLKIYHHHIIIIQRYWRNALNYQKFRLILLNKINQKINIAHSLITKFISNWSLIKTSRRIQIHICSYSLQQFKRLTLQNLHLRELSQLTRIFRTAQTDCTIIYVVPISLTNQVMKYYQRLFALVNKSYNFREKLHIISVEQTLNRISPHLTTISALLYDSKSLKKIRQLVKQNQNEIMGQVCAYIIPCYPSNQYMNLSAELQIPIFSGCQSLSKFYSTKSGYYQLLKPILHHLRSQCPFLLPISASDIYSQKQLINTLAILIYNNKSIKKWILKIDDEINGRGLAIFNTDTLDFIKQLKNKQQSIKTLIHDQHIKQNNIHQISNEQIILILAEQLKVKLKSKLYIVHANIYHNYDSFISHFLTRGGIIQQCIETYHHATNHKPIQHSISFKIQPNGQFQILTTYSKLQFGFKTVSSAIQCPSSLSPSAINNQKIVITLYRHIWSKCKLFGYFTVDCLYSQRKEFGSITKGEIYVIGIDCFLNQPTSSIFVPMFTCEMKYNKQTNQHYTASIDSNKTQYIQKFTRTALKSQRQNSINPKQVQQQNQNSSLPFQKHWNKFQQITFIYCPLLKIKNLPQTLSFFKQCKYNNIQFDIKLKIGTLFLLQQNLQNQCLGFISIHHNKQSIYQDLTTFFNFLSKQYRSLTNKNHHHLKNQDEFDFVGQIKAFFSIVQKKHFQPHQSKLAKQDLNLQYIF